MEYNTAVAGDVERGDAGDMNRMLAEIRALPPDPDAAEAEEVPGELFPFVLSLRKLSAP